ncbi:putative serine threonine protein kinase protein [Rosellinia necatrix]|uniref:Putative serine threonine protein kinase protein n=1 Tax=Rosellinia necatrix TaxID=77044 RepID=A0A1W2TXE8_ROSNE|nr:putative serine threonine protein kinase protein [Rosellinia necatrix]
MDFNPSDEWKAYWRHKMFLQFRGYRLGIEYGKKYDEPILPDLPKQGRPPEVFVSGVKQTALPWVPIVNPIDMDMVATGRFLGPRNLKAFNAVKRLKGYFERKHPGMMYNRCLGWGSNGLAAAFDLKYPPGEKVVVKMVFSEKRNHRNTEVASLRALLKAEHIVQLLYGDNVDETTAIGAGEEPTPNFFITEMLENGDLGQFITLVRQHGERVPNAVLWRFCLCFIRMCIALAHPPSLLKDFKDRPAPISETVPEKYKHEPIPNVHFDFDPKNVFVGNISQKGEHDLTPLLKVIGLAGIST